ncbi:MAG: protein tyrosine phosphatase [Clostridiales bacterium]|nr:protein tyrosine phosphatase [Clostridiales bacterium]
MQEQSTCVSTARGDIIDVHAHVLPGVDDGARDREESIRLLEMAYSQGVRAVIATPHYSRRGRNQGYEEIAVGLEECFRQKHPDFRIWVGQETYYHEELAERLRQGLGHTMAGSRYVLVEYDTGVSFQTLCRGLRQLTDAGYIPILAHLERYSCLYEKGRVEELISHGSKMQMNYESLTGHFYDRQTRWCRKQVLEGHIHLLGSDMHRLDFRPPEITEALAWLKKHTDAAVWDLLVRKNAERIIRDEMIP